MSHLIIVVIDEPVTMIHQEFDCGNWRLAVGCWLLAITYLLLTIDN
jgi:hypothetical protein